MYLIKKLASTAVLLLLAIAGIAQSKTIYLDNALNRSSKADAKYYRTCTTGSSPHKSEIYSIDGNELRMTGYFTDCDSDTKTGMFILYKDGFKAAEGPYENNKMTGDWKFYYDSSNNIWHEDKYRNDSILELISYYKNGKEKRKEKYGPFEMSAGKCFDEEGKEIAFTPFIVKPKPAYVLNTYLSNEMHYPNKARKKNIEGRVIIRFVVDISGNITNVEAIQRVSKELDKEAIRVVSTMPDWIPGSIDGKPVKAYFNLPILFKLED